MECFSDTEPHRTVVPNLCGLAGQREGGEGSRAIWVAAGTFICAQLDLCEQQTIAQVHVCTVQLVGVELRAHVHAWWPAACISWPSARRAQFRIGHGLVVGYGPEVGAPCNRRLANGKSRKGMACANHLKKLTIKLSWFISYFISTSRKNAVIYGGPGGYSVTTGKMFWCPEVFCQVRSILNKRTHVRSILNKRIQKNSLKFSLTNYRWNSKN